MARFALRDEGRSYRDHRSLRRHDRRHRSGHGGAPATHPGNPGIGSCAEGAQLRDEPQPYWLIVVALTAAARRAWYFRDEIVGAFKGVLTYVQPWVDTFLSYVENAVGWIPGVGDKLSAMVGTARTKLGEFTGVMDEAGVGVVDAFVGPVLDPESGIVPSLVGSILEAENDAKAAAATVAEKTAEAFTERFSSSLADARAAGRWIQGPITLEMRRSVCN